jgi:hypothetical protein
MSDLLGEDEPEESSEDAVTADAEEKAGTPS